MGVGTPRKWALTPVLGTTWYYYCPVATDQLGINGRGTCDIRWFGITARSHMYSEHTTYSDFHPVLCLYTPQSLYG